MRKVWLAAVILWSGTAHAAEKTTATRGAIVPTKATSIARIEKTLFDGRVAWKISDGQSEAVIVPEWGRVMSFRRIGAPNWLWQAPPKNYGAGEWKNFGGDKSWPAPQSQWVAINGRGWPPPPEWDGMAHKAGVKNGKLWMVSRVAHGFGMRVVRQFWFDANGDFVIEQAAEKISGAPLFSSLWSVTQIVPPEAIFLPTNPNSAYKNNFHWIAKPKIEIGATSNVSPTLLRVIPSAGNDDNNFKIGTDAPISAAVAVEAGWAFVVRSARPDGEYPDGAEKAGFPVELWNMGPRDIHYNELELLSPLRLYKTGTRWRHTIRWSIHQLPTRDINAPEMPIAIEQILNAK